MSMKPRKINEFHIPKASLNGLAKYIPNDPNKKEVEQTDNIIFSFALFEFHDYFNFGGTCERWVKRMFEVLTMLSKEITPDRLRYEFSGKTTLRYHQHVRGKTQFWPTNISEESLNQGEFSQIRFGKGQGGIHGLLLDNVFYVIWVDPHHNMYPDERYGGLKKFSEPGECCKYRDDELEKLNKKVKEYEEILELSTSPNN